ncbi:MAG: translation initiation factor IF-2 N-terminal domain-containing protein, partial [Pyrinomonadaceae bacterium]|nr:translation initiation factor IF-2 N-terminal domain-containing protein [Pyrinomonadaceae bacterium]
MTSSKVRIYDLAKDLKLDSKRVMEEVRREGVDVSVPSNTISKELAEKIRNKYFPKKEAVVARSVRVVKKAARPASEEISIEAAGEDSSQDFSTNAPTTSELVSPPAVAQTPARSSASAPRLLKRLQPAARAEQPPVQLPTVTDAPHSQFADDSEIGSADAQDDAQLATTAAMELDEELSGDLASEITLEDGVSSAPAPFAPRAVEPAAQARQVRVLRPTAAALNAGIRHGDRAPAPI